VDNSPVTQKKKKKKKSHHGAHAQWPGGINVHGLMDCLLKHFQFVPEYTVVSEYGGDASGDIAAAIPTWCRSDVCIAELRAPVSDAKLARLPSAFTCFGQRVSVSVQPSILAKAHLYQHRAQSHVQQDTETQRQPPHCRPEPNAGSSNRQGLRRQLYGKQNSSNSGSSSSSSNNRPYILLSTLFFFFFPACCLTFHPAASVDSMPPANRLVLGRSLTLS